MMKNKIAIKLLSSCICCLSLCNSYALSPLKSETNKFILKITSDKPQLFFGTYLTNNGLTYIHKKTPFELKINGKELRLMLGSYPTNPSITVELLKQDKNNGQFERVVSKATGHSIFMCESSIMHNGRNSCDVSVLSN